MFTVVCKATFALKHGQTATLASPEAPAVADMPWPRDSQSIGVPTDLVPFKRNVDVLLIGHAYAPKRMPVTSLFAGLSVGTFAKSIQVTGDRTWEPNGTCLEPEPFNRMPICWERAAGGSSTWNPIGVPACARIDPRHRPRIPNLLPRGFVLENSTQLVPPVGFGAIAPHWPARASYVQKWAASWNHAKWYEGLLPQELDAAYFNAAPADQQLRELPETTQITLEHFNPDVPRLVSVIDDLRPRAIITRSPGVAPQEVWLRADTMLIDVDRLTCSVTWRATIALRHPQEDGVVYVEPTRGFAAPTPVKAHLVLPFQNATPAPSASASTNSSASTNPVQSNRASAPDNRRWDTAQMAMPVDEFTTLPLRNEPPNPPAPLPFRPPLPSAPPSGLAFAPPPLPPRRESPSVGAFGEEFTKARSVPEKPVESSSVPFRPPAPSQLNLRADDDEVTAIHARSAPKPSNAASPESPLLFAKTAPIPSRAGVLVVKTVVPNTPPSTESTLPFRPTARVPEDLSSARNRFAALSTSSVLPFQTSDARGETPPPRERLPSVPHTSAFTVALPLAQPSVPAPPASVSLASSPAPLSSSSLPLQTPPTNGPPLPRERLPSIPSTGLLFAAPLAAPLAASLGAVPPAPPSVPAMGMPLSAPGLHFQTPPTNEARQRERLASVPPDMVSAPLQAAQAIASPNESVFAPAVDAPRPMQWSRLSGPSDDIKPTIPASKAEASPRPGAKSELSFERYARIKVHLRDANASREDVLSKNGLDEIEWRILEQHQTDALDHEAKEGKCDLALTLLAAFEVANAPSLMAP